MNAQLTSPTSIELKIAKHLHLANIPYVSQQPLGPWIADFFLVDRDIIIECDGDYWHSLPDQVQKDRRKNHWYRKHGYLCIRFSERDIHDNIEKIMQTILRAVHISDAQRQLNLWEAS